MKAALRKYAPLLFCVSLLLLVMLSPSPAETGIQGRVVFWALVGIGCWTIDWIRE